MQKLLFLLVLNIVAIHQSAIADPANIVWTKYTHNIERLQFSKDDSKILTVGEGSIIIFDTQTNQQLIELPGGDGQYSDDGSLIFSLNQVHDSIGHIGGYRIDIYNSTTYVKIKSINAFELSNADYGLIRVSSDGLTIAAANEWAIYLYDYPTGTLKKSFTHFGNETRSVCIVDFVLSKDGNDLIVTLTDPVKGNYGELMFINLQTNQMNYIDKMSNGMVVLSDDGSLLAYQTEKSGTAVEIMNTRTHEIINSIAGNTHNVAGIFISYDNQFIAISYGFNEFYLKVWNIQTNKEIHTFYTDPEGYGFTCPNISRNNQYIIGNSGNYFYLFDLWQFTEILQNCINNQVELIYPNPTINSINVTFNLPFPCYLNFNLYDITGNKLKNLKNCYYTPGIINEKLVLENLSEGLYFLKAESRDFNRTFKIMIK